MSGTEVAMRHDAIDPGRPYESARTATWPEARVGQRVRRAAVTIGRAVSVHDAWKAMKTLGVRHLAVVSPENRLVGLVSERDLRRFSVDPTIHGELVRLDRFFDELTVERVMTPDPPFVTADVEVRRAATLMRRCGVDAVPVLEGDRVVGILTEAEALEVLLETAVSGAAWRPPGMDRAG
jgi:CBS domain-containing protein